MALSEVELRAAPGIRFFWPRLARSGHLSHSCHGQETPLAATLYLALQRSGPEFYRA